MSLVLVGVCWLVPISIHLISLKNPTATDAVSGGGIGLERESHPIEETNHEISQRGFAWDSHTDRDYRRLCILVDRSFGAGIIWFMLMGSSVFVWNSYNWTRGRSWRESILHNNHERWSGVSYNLTEAHSSDIHLHQTTHRPLAGSRVIGNDNNVNFDASSPTQCRTSPSPSYYISNMWLFWIERSIAEGSEDSRIGLHERHTDKQEDVPSRTVASWWTRSEFNFSSGVIHSFSHPNGPLPQLSSAPWQWQIPPITLCDYYYYGSLVVILEFVHRFMAVEGEGVES